MDNVTCDLCRRFRLYPDRSVDQGGANTNGAGACYHAAPVVNAEGRTVRPTVRKDDPACAEFAARF